jgi:hypothetical protein
MSTSSAGSMRTGTVAAVIISSVGISNIVYYDIERGAAMLDILS